MRFRSLDSAGLGGSPAGDQYLVFKQNTRSSDFEGFDLSKTRVGGGDVFRFLICSSSGQGVEIRSTTTISTGTWYHVAAVRGTNFTQIYVNGQLERQTNVTFAQNYGTLPLYFGSSGQSLWDHKLKGFLDEVSIYNRALSAAEIAAIYSAGSDGKCKAAAKGLAVAVPSRNQIVLPAPRFASVALLPDGNPRFALETVSNLTLRIDASADLVSWKTLTNISEGDGAPQFKDQDATNFSKRFYRAVRVP